MRYVRGYDETDPRPPLARTLDAAVEASREYGRVGLELSLGTQASDRMVGEPTTFTKGWFDAWPDAVDATPLLAAARAIKTDQELERIRLKYDRGEPAAGGEVARLRQHHVGADAAIVVGLRFSPCVISAIGSRPSALAGRTTNASRR